MVPSKVFLGVPSYAHDLSWGASRATWRTATRVHRFDVCQSTSSLISFNCNMLWCSALNFRVPKELEWFAMLHTDVEPTDWWIDTLIEEAEKHGADMMSVVIPLKNSSGSTSTAIANPSSPYGQFCRLTLSQIRHPDFPDTFGIVEAADALARLPEPLRIADAPRATLLVNTGCFVCRLNRPWAEKVWFEQSDTIEFREGLWSPLSQPEDWNFSRRLAAHGGKVMATRLVKVIHRGGAEFHSDQTWGQPRDLG